MKIIRSFGTATVLIAFAMAGLHSSVFAQGVAEIIYSPDMVDARFAEELQHGLTPPSGLPAVMPFNADMVNVEKIVGDGEGVYVAVLDTGVLPAAPFFFSQASRLHPTKLTSNKIKLNAVLFFPRKVTLIEPLFKVKKSNP